MEIIGIIIVIWIVWKIVADIVKKHHQDIRDKVAHEVLDNTFNFTNEKAEVLAINKNLGFVKTDKIYPSCMSCDGILVARYGSYGPFWGCSNYPKCKFWKRIN